MKKWVTILIAVVGLAALIAFGYFKANPFRFGPAPQRALTLSNISTITGIKFPEQAQLLNHQEIAWIDYVLLCKIQIPAQDLETMLTHEPFSRMHFTGPESGPSDLAHQDRRLAWWDTANIQNWKEGNITLDKGSLQVLVDYDQANLCILYMVWMRGPVQAESIHLKPDNPKTKVDINTVKRLTDPNFQSLLNAQIKATQTQQANHDKPTEPSPERQLLIAYGIFAGFFIVLLLFKRLLNRSTPPEVTVEPDTDLEELYHYLDTQLRGGYLDPKEILTSAYDYFDENSEWVKQKAPEIVDELVNNLYVEQAQWPEVTDCDRLDEAFSYLEKKGILCQQNFSCCGNCGAGEIWDEIQSAKENGRQIRGYVFFHSQDTESGVEGDGLYINYGSTENGDIAMLAIANEILDGLHEYGLQTEWDRSLTKRIKIFVDWKRRAPWMKEPKPFKMN
jgi:hypothetical protein